MKAKPTYMVSKHFAYLVEGAMRDYKVGDVLSLTSRPTSAADKIVCLLCTPAEALIVVAVQSDALVCHRRLLRFNERWKMLVETMKGTRWS